MKLFKTLKTRDSEMPAGFSLIEVLVALSLFSVVSALMIPSFLYHLKTNYKAEVKNGAIAAAQESLDLLRSDNPSSLPSSGSTTQNIAVGERTFSVKTLYCKTAAWCSSASRNINVEVSYKNKLIYSTETVFSQLR